jgi:hypothetical protein
MKSGLSQDLAAGFMPQQRGGLCCVLRTDRPPEAAWDGRLEMTDAERGVHPDPVGRQRPVQKIPEAAGGLASDAVIREPGVTIPASTAPSRRGS